MSGRPWGKMSSLLSPPEYLRFLGCPRCGHKPLAAMGPDAFCPVCKQVYSASVDGVLEFVVDSELDAATAQELAGHTFNFTPQQTESFMRQEKALLWRNYYSRNRMGSIRRLARFLDRVDCRQVFFLGVGTGREIEYLLSFRDLHTVYCSDLSYTALRMVPARLAGRGLEIGLFTSDLQHCPVVSSEVPVVIVNALHHTQDMHTSLDGLLGKRFDDLFLIEPTDNFLIRFLARLGLAQRREYSGVIPGRLDLPRLKAMCQRHGYRLTLKTRWEFPRDYYKKLFGMSQGLQRLFFPMLNGFSSLTNLIQFGNFSIVHLARVDAEEASPGRGAG